MFKDMKNMVKHRGDSMKIGDLLIPIEDCPKPPLYIYLGRGIWRGWIRVFHIQGSRKMSLRKDFVKVVKKCP